MRRPLRGLDTVGAACFIVLALGPSAQARVVRAGDKAKPTASRKAPAKTPPKPNGKPATKAPVETKPGNEAAALPAPKGKVAVFAFTGDGAAPLHKEVLHVLQAKGLKVLASIRPMDSPEQYRELAETLDLIAFVDGETEVDGAQGSATIHVRNGVSGLRVASATFAGDKKKLPAEVGRALWEQLLNALSQATVDAAGPRRHDRAPLRIEAGTPLSNAPADNLAASPRPGAP
jgi:hypothetical protein